MSKKNKLQKISDVIERIRTETASEITKLQNTNIGLTQTNSEITSVLQIQIEENKKNLQQKDTLTKTLEKTEAQLHETKEEKQKIQQSLIEAEEKNGKLQTEITDGKKEVANYLQELSTQKELIKKLEDQLKQNPLSNENLPSIPNIDKTTMLGNIEHQTQLVASYTEQLKMMLSQNQALLQNHAMLQTINLELMKQLAGK
jgi:chromosome segregation ATPase